MALEQKLSVRMSQRLIMTPSLQQAIKLLQMSKLELVDEIQQELTENPVLEESAEEAATPAERAEAEPAPAETTEAREASEAGEAEAEPADPFDDIDYESYFQDVEGSFVPRGPIDTGEEFPSFESTLAKTPNLADHLTWQLDMTAADARTKEIGQAIIGKLNEDGYLRASLEELREMGEFTADEVRTTVEL